MAECKRCHTSKPYYVAGCYLSDEACEAAAESFKRGYAEAVADAKRLIRVRSEYLGLGRVRHTEEIDFTDLEAREREVCGG